MIRCADGWRVDQAAVEANTVPTLGIVGSRDPLREAAQHMAEHLGAFVRLALIDGADHVQAVYVPENAARFAALVAEFVEGAPVPGTADPGGA